MIKNRLSPIALRTSVVYIILGGLWILFSDRAATLIAQNEAMYVQISTYKGWLFVLVTGTLLYLTLRTQLQRWSAEFDGRRKAEDELRANQERLQLLIESTEDILLMQDIEGRYLHYLGPTLLGVDATDRIGKFPLDVLEANEAGKTMARHRKVLAEGRSIVEDDLVCQHGEAIWYSTKVSPVCDPSGRIFSTITISHNITARKRIEEVLRLSEKRFKRALENIPDIVIIYDRDLRYEYANRSFTRWLPGPSEGIAGKRDEELWPPGVYGEYLQLLRDAREKKEERSEELTIQTPDGQMVTLQTTIIPLLDENGEVREVLGVAHDLTERKKAEEAIRSSEERFRSYVENAPVAVFLADDEGRYIDGNPAAVRLLGYEISELSTKMIGDFVEPHERPSVETYYAKLRATGKVETELQVIRKDGNKIWVSINIVSIGNHRYMGYAIDVTHRTMAEAQLKASLREKEVLLKEIHHRVKNNLQVISSLLNLQAQEIVDETARNAFSESRHRVRSMALIHENLYRSENLASIRFDEYLQTMTTELWRSFNRQEVKRTLRVNPIVLELDKAVPCGLIVNELVTNALKHAFPDKRAGNVVIVLESAESSRIRLVVSDDGAGIPPNTDFRTMTSMGMTLILSLTRQIDGTITLDRTSGTKFVVEFPG